MKKSTTEIECEVVEEVENDNTGEITEAQSRKVLLERDHELTEDDFGILKEAGVKKVHIQKIGSEESDRSVIMKDRKSTRLNSSHVAISYAVFCLKKKIYTYASKVLNDRQAASAI